MNNITFDKLYETENVTNINSLPSFLYTVKPVFKGHLNIQEKVSLHHRCPIIRFLNMGKI